MAIINGWYKMITTGLPLNVGRTVFGVYFMEGYYKPQPVSELCMELYDWGMKDQIRNEKEMAEWEANGRKNPLSHH